MDKLVVIQSIAYLPTSNGYQDDVNNEDYGGEESSEQDYCEADDRREARSTIAFGPVQLGVTPLAEKGENGHDQRDKGEAASDGVQDKGGGQRL